ncbi:MAG: cytochrome-c peroxidase [ANME-2 cluster archaeon]|nr:cytochrome-c peroxidase [ANME-2 cluster archaeon]MBC2701267.1 cytochrome-c peroxidase [ANME-2 cluster archaeon]MBC2708656.1 cytochrome-c peroxidase [ANME-2 cluster archaeon]MBC2748632.1 cytochrome-c peroxidase [ANME-2 cluster archaeon]MBC2762290.1 cytochrome-c peroxidase [ANME-2 cluster archaeon]
MNIRICMYAAIILFVATTGIASANDLTPQEELGKLLFFDTDLSVPQGQSCASCHDPDFGFADPDSSRAVSMGAIHVRFGDRNSPTAAYAGYSPDFHYDVDEGIYIGGQFWDGRAANLAEQAKGPFLNPLEMNNPSKQAVIQKIRNSDYVDLFEVVYGEDALDDVDMAYDQVADAIAAFEMTDEVNRFSSKYDKYLAGEVSLTKEEKRGLKLFNNPKKGNCAACHLSTAGPYADEPLFTDFTYDNLGVPSNLGMLGDSPELMNYYPFYYQPLAPNFNPNGLNFVDYGLGGIVPGETGKVKVPTLRNVAITSPYMHNGAFTTLKEVVHFYNTRDVPGEVWPAPEVGENVNTDELGDLGLTDGQEDAIVAFMETLTDGY